MSFEPRLQVVLKKDSGWEEEIRKEPQGLLKGVGGEYEKDHSCT